MPMPERQSKEEYRKLQEKGLAKVSYSEAMKRVKDRDKQHAKEAYEDRKITLR